VSKRSQSFIPLQYKVHSQHRDDCADNGDYEDLYQGFTGQIGLPLSYHHPAMIPVVLVGSSGGGLVIRRQRLAEMSPKLQQSIVMGINHDFCQFRSLHYPNQGIL
jgi:hypothetical protein